MFLPIANFSFAIMSARRTLWRWRVERQLIVALEFGYDEEIVKRVLKKCEFDDAGDLLDYLDTHNEELEAEKEVEEEPTPEEEKELPQASAQPLTPSAPPPTESSLRQETEDLYRRSICLNCFRRRRCFVVLPCSHFSICDNCEKELRKCPARDCGEAIECSIKTYM